MGIITKEVKTKWNNMNKSWLMSKGYNYTSYRDEVIVNVNDLQKGSSIIIECECDWCKKESSTTYSEYNKIIKKYGNYLCLSCRCKEQNIINKKVLYYTHPELAKKLKNKEDAFLYSYWTEEKLDFVCEYCNTVYKSSPYRLDMAKSNLCPNCNDGFSYNNKFINNVLSQTNIKYEREFFDSDWTYIYYNNECHRAIYDFVLYLKDGKYVIEADGNWHHEDNYLSGQTKNMSEKIDKLKNELMLNHGYKVVRIDCSINTYKDTTNIDQKIKRQLLDVFKDKIDFSKVNWDLCNKQSLQSEYKVVWDLINQGYTKNEINEKTKLSLYFITKAVKKGKDLGVIKYKMTYEIAEENKNKVKELWDSGIFDINEILINTNIKNETTVRDHLNRIYEQTNDLFYKITSHKYYYCIDEDIYYSRDALFNKMKDKIRIDKYNSKDKIISRINAAIWKSIKRDGSYYGYKWKVVSRQEAYLDKRLHNKIIIE